MQKPRTVTQIMAGFAATMIMVSAGYHVGWSSPSLPKLEATDSEILLTSDEGSWIVSVFGFGCFFGSPISSLIVDKLGRKRSLLFSAIPLVISGVLLSVARSYWWLISARFIAGTGSCMCYSSIPMYLAEIASDDIRGALGAMIITMFNAGVLISYCVGPWMSRVAFASLGIALPVVFCSMFVWMPESPYYLIMKNDRNGAVKSLQWLRGRVDITVEVAKIDASIEFDRKNAGTFMDLVKVRGNRKASCIAFGLVFAQQLSGVSAVLAYGGLIMEAAGTRFDPSVSVILIGCIQVVSSIMCVFIVDLMGRKPLLLISTFGSIVLLGGVALYFQLVALEVDVRSIWWLPLISMSGYIFFFTFGLGLLQCVVLSEIFPYNVKAVAASASSLVGSFGGIVVSKLYQIVADAWGIHISFWGFTVITIFSAVFIVFVVPETKQRSLQEIQEELHKNTESKTTIEELDDCGVISLHF
ncbi:facilitated trehalose transporter Tret1-2 homolog [Athalia rosae]|uniref:facilitated trehalose transporter Tret1-2 homolog n=1 Tax=Athalia rosae TaxID=37344 RepID=UPI002034192E|nr:facilitated trehalose transporter Tret1-2 homolog [Athalia rosae]